ncbi:hypothetical protein QN277_021148 [Acacia crassicarpa]|nr:hypothetical protein QN277_021148 [Acacia crassicarpa]
MPDSYCAFISVITLQPDSSLSSQPELSFSLCNNLFEKQSIEILGVESVSVNVEDELAVGVMDGEAVAGEEERGLEDNDMGFFFEDIGVLDKK